MDRPKAVAAQSRDRGSSRKARLSTGLVWPCDDDPRGCELIDVEIRPPMARNVYGFPYPDPLPIFRKEATVTAKSERYALSFTSGGLLVREAGVIVAEYLRERDWAAVRQVVVDQNLLQARTRSSSVRVARETIQRLRVLDDSELEILADASPTERCHLMWAAACRRYDLIGEFAEEVVRERFLLMTPTVDIEDFERFMVSKALWHPELDELRPSTRDELRKSLFLMLNRAGLRASDGTIIPAVISERVHGVLAALEPSDIRFFPTTLTVEATR